MYFHVLRLLSATCSLKVYHFFSPENCLLNKGRTDLISQLSV